MKQSDLQIKDKNLFHEIIKQIPGKKFKFLANSVTQEEAASVEELKFKNMEISDFQFLRYFPNINSIELSHITGIQDITGFTYLPKLTGLFLYETVIEDMSPIGRCSGLLYLDYCLEEIKDGGREDFRFLTNLRNLDMLDLSYNKVNDLSFVEQLPNLTQLVMSGNPIQSTEPIRALKKLTFLELEHCGLEELKGLEELSNLEHLYAEGNLFSQELREKYRQILSDVKLFM